MSIKGKNFTGCSDVTATLEPAAKIGTAIVKVRETAIFIIEV
jgi:hypothetical protein